MAISLPLPHARHTRFAEAERAEQFAIGRCPGAANAAPLDGHTAGIPPRIPGTANSPAPGAPDIRAPRPRPTSVPLVPRTRVLQFPEFVGTVHDLASPDCRIWSS